MGKSGGHALPALRAGDMSPVAAREPYAGVEGAWCVLAEDWASRDERSEREQMFPTGLRHVVAPCNAC